MKYHNASLVGSTGEQLVAQWLEDRGYTIVCRNYKRRYGEIDLIARNKTELCFVEVKTRISPSFAISEVLIASKRHKIIRTAREYLAHNPCSNMICRFDVALVQPDEPEVITYIPNAFNQEGL